MTGDVESGRYGRAGAERDTEERGGPLTPGEQRLAALWAGVLGVPAGRIGRTDNFFEIGGTSRAAVRLVIALGHRLTVDEFARTPVLAEQAGLLESRNATGPVPAAAAPAAAAAAGPGAGG
ncbi:MULTISPECIES: phosphopantetheine-binding protein [Streptomyces]|uniref:phosphopantetheine-binding protein n=1 Tax=Streptomyces TaxID=1883 RepID=UPI0024AD7217|nr:MULTISPECIES: phosphopantetheine-binding protein [Streptomyces]MDI6413499.1 phosphopantetheine-binding protein [Streptomyces albus]GHJ23461.1 hypothetical protein TPA0909_50750 [Streptomyces albus]